MDLEKLIKKAAKTYSSGEADQLMNQASRTANRMFNELLPEKTKEHNLVKGLKEVADQVLTDSGKSGSASSSNDPLVRSLKQGLKGLRKTADHYASKIEADDSGQSAKATADLANEAFAKAEKLGSAFFSRSKDRS